MARLEQNLLSGTLDSDLGGLTSDTSMSSPALANMVVVAGSDTMQVVLDPDGTAGDPEIVTVTAHASSGTTATIVREQEGTSVRAHLTGTDWVQCVTVDKYDDYEDHYRGRLPVGAVIPYAGTSSPDTAEYLLCSGQTVSRTTYSALFTVIGETFGAGDGSTTFAVPDLRGRTVVGLDNMGGSSANNLTASAADSLGGALGDEEHQLSTSELPSHQHSIDHNHSSFTSAGESGHTHSISHDHGSFTSGGESGHTHNPASGTSGFIMNRLGTGTSATVGGNVVTTITNTGSSTGHTHTINPPSFSGTSGGSSGHTHSIDVPQFNGNSGSVGNSDAHNNVQPSLALGYLIRV